jgi:hypothetical protein
MKKSGINLFKGIFLLNLLCLSSTSFAQVFTYFNPEVTGPNGLIPNPWAGGLTAPQFSEIDLNNDGNMDLYYFDKDGFVHEFYINDGIPGVLSYKYDPSYGSNFPECESWVHLEDLSGDGVLDLMTFTDEIGVSGIKMYEGSINSDGEYEFEAITNSEDEYPFLVFNYQNSEVNIYSTKEDYPEFVDADYDGDIDILNFGSDGSYVKMYENVTDEDSDQLEFVLGDFCWGGFKEGSLNQIISLNLTDSTGCVNCLTNDDNPNQNPVHPGSTLCAFDEDGDGDLDLLIGDVTNRYIVFTRNGGSLTNEWMTESDSIYPSYDVSAYISEFPVAFHQDFDSDGNQDLMITNFNQNGVENYDLTWFYRNLGSDDDPEFSLESESSFTDLMLDFGSVSSPTFFDYNADGLKDILIGTEGYYLENGYDPRLILMINTGTPSEPSFEIADSDFLNIQNFTSDKNFAPTFGDLDNDGDLDLLVGQKSGELIYFENTAGEGNTCSFANPETGWKGIDIGQNSSPFIFDVDVDGDMDLLIGERSGNVNLIRNIGTPANFECNTDLTFELNNPFLGGVSAVGQSGGIVGNSSPYMLWVDGNLELFLGAQSGHLYRFTDVWDNLEQGATFTDISNLVQLPHNGFNRKIAFANLNDDNLLEFVSGNRRGGLSLYGTDLEEFMTIDNTNNHSFVDLGISVYPNPTRKELYVSLGDDYKFEMLRVYDSAGRLVLTSMDSNVDCSTLKTGIYILEVSAENGLRGFSKFVRQ